MKWSSENFTITVPDCDLIGNISGIGTDEIEKAKEFVKLNSAALEALWNDQIDFIGFAKMMKKI